MLSAALHLTPMHAVPHRACAPHMAAPTRVICLDFDGVLCDSEPALTRIAWRAACERWPDVMSATLALDPKTAGARRSWTGGSWEPLKGENADGMPNWLAAKMRKLRPVISSAHESTLMLRLCADEALAASKDRAGRRPLTPGEIASNWGEDMRESLLARYAFRTPQEAVDMYEAARDDWFTAEPDKWLAASSTFYDGAVEAVRTVDASSDSDSTAVYVVTSRPRAATRALLSAAGLPLDDDRVLADVDGDAAKAAAIVELRQRHADATIAFVDDRVTPLRTVANNLGLFGIELYHARWGYSTPQQEAEAAAMPRVRGLGPESAELARALRGDETEAEAEA